MPSFLLEVSRDPGYPGSLSQKSDLLRTKILDSNVLYGFTHFENFVIHTVSHCFTKIWMSHYASGIASTCEYDAGKHSKPDASSH